VESNPRAIPPRVEDSDLLAGDVAVLWLFALTQKTASVALSSSFPGWLAPVAVNPASAASFLGESTWLIATWIAVNAVIGGYELDPLRLGKEEGEMREAVKGAAVAWAAWCVPAFGGLTWFEKATGLSPSFPVGVTLGTALGCDDRVARVRQGGGVDGVVEGRAGAEREGGGGLVVTVQVSRRRHSCGVCGGGGGLCGVRGDGPRGDGRVVTYPSVPRVC